MNAEVLDDRVGQQSFCDLTDHALVNRITDLEFESLSLPDPMDTMVAKPLQCPVDGLALRVGDLGFEHDIDDDPGHAGSLTPTT